MILNTKRLPWVSNSNPPQPLWGCALFHASIPNVAAERQRWAGGRYRFAVLKWHRSTLFIQPTQLDQRFLKFVGHYRIVFPSADSISSTPSSAVRLFTSRAVLISTTSSERM